MRRYYEKPYANKFDNLDKIGKFTEEHSLAKVTQKEKENVNNSVSTKEAAFIIQSLLIIKYLQLASLVNFPNH